MTHDYRIDRPSDPSNLARAVIAVMWSKVNFYEGSKTLEWTLSGATPGQRAVYACTWYLSEVNNGGHGQFFFNGTGSLWKEAVEGFGLLGAREYQEIIQMAGAKFGSAGPPRDPRRRRDEVDALPLASFEAFDSDLLALQRRSPLGDWVLPYIDQHPDEFFK